MLDGEIAVGQECLRRVAASAYAANVLQLFRDHMEDDSSVWSKSLVIALSPPWAAYALGKSSISSLSITLLQA